MLNLLYSVGAWRLSITAVVLAFVPAAIVYGQCVLPVPVPAPAQAQGFTTLALDGDMTKGFDVSCANPATSNHQWYLGGDRSMYSNCANLNYPHTDETDGSTVLDIHLGPSTQDGGILGRVGIATIDMHGAHSNDYPINAYYECTMRFDSYSIDHAGLLSNCWEADATTIKTGSGINTIEYDFTEIRGGYQYSTLIGNSINWSCGGPGTCRFFSWGGDPANYVPGFDPAKFHKYGVLMYQTGPGTLHMKSYVDDVFIAEGDAGLESTPGGPPNADNLKQRNAFVVNLSLGCTWIEGDSGCQNIGITNVYPDSNGKVHIQLASKLQAADDYWPSLVAEVTGVPGVNGVHWKKDDNLAWWLPGFPCLDSNQNPGAPCTITLLNASAGLRGGVPLDYPGGTYTGGGIMNKWVDPGWHGYVKSVRVWSCANWKTTQCSAYNPN